MSRPHPELTQTVAPAPPPPASSHGRRYDDCDDGHPGQRPASVHLMLRQWFDVDPSLEFRLFVKQNTLIGEATSRLGADEGRIVVRIRG